MHTSMDRLALLACCAGSAYYLTNAHSSVYATREGRGTVEDLAKIETEVESNTDSDRLGEGLCLG